MSEQGSGGQQEATSGLGQQERTWGMLCHLLALAGFVIPFGNLVGPIIIWQIKRQEMPFVDDQGKESVNFQISVTIYAFAAGLTMLLGIGLVLLPVVGLFSLVMVIIASVQANQGTQYRYPACIRFIK